MILLRLNLPCTFCQRVNMKILGQQNQWKGRHQGRHVDSSLAAALNVLWVQCGHCHATKKYKFEAKKMKCYTRLINIPHI